VLVTDARWPRLGGSGLAWAFVYNVLWGAAWLLFMRRIWHQAAAGFGRSLPWTLDVWLLWAALTVPIGWAIMAYARSHARPSPPALRGTVVVWVLMSGGMLGWGLQDSLSLQVLLLDCGVNLVAMAAATSGGWPDPHSGLGRCPPPPLVARAARIPVPGRTG
jgi:hypothetical protein